LGPLFFITYISPIEHLINMFNVGQIAYADDATLFINLESSSLAVLSKCLSSLSDWFLFNDLMLNPDKSQCLKSGTRQQVKSNCVSTLNICDVIVPFSDTITVLGVTFDCSLNFDKQISSICSAASYHLKSLKHIRKCIDQDTAKTIAAAFIASRLDYCNAVLAGISDYNVLRLQRVQNTAARIVLNRTKGSAIECRRQLHWLPISQRLEYKTLLLVFKVLHCGQPYYLRSLLTVSKPVRALRSSTHGILLDVRFCKTEMAARAFSVYAPKLWNALPADIRALVDTRDDLSVCIVKFKSMLKTLLFKRAYCADG